MLAAAKSNSARGKNRGAKNGRYYGPKSGNGGVTPDKKDGKLKKFHPLIKGITPEHSFEDVKKELVKNLELMTLEKADDIIESVRDMQLLDVEALKPNMKISQLTVAADKEAEKDNFREEYKHENKTWERRLDAMKNNKHKLHAKVLKYCSKEMEQKLERESDYETVLYKDPITLLKRIRKFMTTSEETDYQWFHLWEALQRLMNCKQGSNEAPNDFRKRIEDSATAVKALLGKDCMKHFARNTKGFDVLTTQNDKDNYAENTWEMFLPA